VKSVDESIYEPIRPEGDIDEKTINTLQTRRQKKLDLAKTRTEDLVVPRDTLLMIDSCYSRCCEEFKVASCR
jgi:hypothetical protein